MGPTSAASPGQGLGASPRFASPLTNPATSRELDPAINPYAGALRGPGLSRRAWDENFLRIHRQVAAGDAIQFELTQKVLAEGTVRITQFREGELTYFSGELTQPEAGRFFFLAPPENGKAGKAVGVVEFPGSQTAYRIEPTGPDGASEFWQRHLDEVVCLTMPLMETAAAEVPANIPPLRPDAVTDSVPSYNSNIVSLQSYPGSPAVLLLDFFGGYTPTWGGVNYPRPSVSNADIKDLWKRVAEDYMPFNVNVTTDLRVYQNAPAASRQRCVLTPSTSAMPAGAAGVAYIGSWNWGSDTVCWSIYTSGKAGGEVGAHEVGHTLGLGHQGTSTQGYYGGQGSGATGWAPIMGVGYYQPVSSWAKGEYADANNHEDELNIITTKNNSVTYRPDDTGNVLAISRYLEVYPGGSASAQGVIERTSDTDAFQFTTTGGQVSLTAAPVGDWSDLALMATLANASDTVIASNNPQTVLSASITATLTNGTYTFRVTGAGRNNALTNGFSAYASLGYYSVTGSVAGARLPTRLTVAEHSPNGTLVGTVPASAPAHSLHYAIGSGNTGNTFVIDDFGTVRVANNSLLDYFRMATNTMLPVQFELFVDINDLTDPTATELSRRVVIAVLNVNDPPIVAGFTNTVIAHTQTGTVLGTVVARDPDLTDALSYSIVGGDSAGVFAVDPWGVVTLAGDVDTGVQAVYDLIIAVSDNVIPDSLSATGYVRINVITNSSPFHPGSISYAAYDNSGSSQLVSSLTGNSRWPADPDSEIQLTTFEGPSDRADNYGAAMRGFLIPPQSGSYTFWIATDDNGELWLSSSTNTATISRIAYIGGANNWASSRQWTKFSTQQSPPVSLVAGQAYYVEARMKEGGGGDNIAVAWKGPATSNQTNIISGLFLAPCSPNYIPHLTGFEATVLQRAFAGTVLGSVRVTDLNANDDHSFAITAGNTDGLFGINTNTGVLYVVDQAGLSSALPGDYSLEVTAVDSGAPPLSATATVTIHLLAADALNVTSIYREMWHNIGSGTAVSDLTNNAAFPRRPDSLVPLTDFLSARDIADNYGSRIRAYLTPIDSGAYRFFIASDDGGTLWLSTDDSPTNTVRIAYVPGWSDYTNWTKYSQQTSGSINLVGGQRYYIEALQKEGGGGDHVAVGWSGPGLSGTNVIPGAYLSPVDLNYPPVINDQTLVVLSSIPSGAAIGRVTALDSPLDTLSFKLVGGDTNNIFSLAPDTGVITLLDNTLIADRTLTNIPLTVAVQDSGYSGLFPIRSSQAYVTIRVQAPGGPLVWSGAAPTNAWSDSGNWAGGSPAPGSRLIFGSPFQQTNVDDALGSIDWVLFTNGGFNLLGSAVTLASGLTNSGNNSWGMPVTLTAAQTWRSSTGTMTINAPVTNAGFTLTLSAIGDLRVAGPISGSGGLNKSGAARLLIQGTHSYSGTTIVAGTGSTSTALEVNGAQDLDIGNSDLTLNGRMDLGSHSARIGALNGNGIVFASDSMRTLTLGANDHSGIFSGTIQNSSSGSSVILNVLKTGAGEQALSGMNTFSGLLGVRAGVLTAQSSGALGSAAGGTIVGDGATLALAGNFTISAEPLTLSGTGVNGSGALRLNSGQVTFNGPITLAGPATISAVSGQLVLGGAWNPAGNGVTFDVAAGASIVVNSGIGAAAGLTKTGSGTLTLNGINGYPGTTVVNGGVIALAGSGALAVNSDIVLSNDATLDLTGFPAGWTLGALQSLRGVGTVIGSANILGTLKPGNSVGVIAVTGNVTLAGSAIFEVARTSGALTNDQLVCSGTLTLGGTLNVTSTGSDPLAPGDSFQLFTAAAFGGGAFATINLPVLAPELVWDTSRLAVDGTLRVVTSEPTVPPNLVSAIQGGTLSLSWSPDYSSYVLQGQTNPPEQGLGDAWYPVPGVISNQVSLPLDPNQASVFYRLFKP
jgi:autotransporter-associated beta strand protein